MHFFINIARGYDINTLPSVYLNENLDLWNDMTFWKDNILWENYSLEMLGNVFFLLYNLHIIQKKITELNLLKFY